MTTAEKLSLVAQSDTAFSKQDGVWTGKCLICNGPMAFDASSGEGASLEHIRARTRGGTDDPANLAIVHPSCNWEKGRRWDPKNRRPIEEYEALVARMQARRKARWRDIPHETT
jgi:5-methylcytosine-specific restriction endonuclease McrA